MGVAPTCMHTMADLGALHTALQYACSQEESELKMGEKQLLSWENQPGYYSGLAVSTEPLLIIGISNIHVYFSNVYFSYRFKASKKQITPFLCFLLKGDLFRSKLPCQRPLDGNNLFKEWD